MISFRVADIQVADYFLHSSQCFPLLKVIKGFYHRAVWALIPLLVSSVSHIVVSACCLCGSFVVDGYAAFSVDTYTGRVQICGCEGCKEGCKDEDGGCGTHHVGIAKVWMSEAKKY